MPAPIVTAQSSSSRIRVTSAQNTEVSDLEQLVAQADAPPLPEAAPAPAAAPEIPAAAQLPAMSGTAVEVPPLNVPADLQKALAALHDQLQPKNPHTYLHVGFNELDGGLFFPVAGGISQQHVGLVIPALEHDAADGFLWIPGVSWHPLNLGYIGDTSSVHDFLHGRLALGPSVQTGDTVKMLLRAACSFLPNWDSQYGALKAVLAPGNQGVYADVGVYESIPVNGLGNPLHLKFETDLAATINKRWGSSSK